MYRLFVVVAELFQGVEELVVRHESELAEACMGELVQVTDGGGDEALPRVGVRMFNFGFEFDKIVLAPVELISVEMMNVALWITRSVPDLVHGMMAKETPWTGIIDKIR